MTATIMGLNALTSIAAGTGQNLGIIDLPIMREAPTGYPVVFGSALKGAMRAATEKEAAKRELAKELFGDDDKGGSSYAGALIVSDAKLLLLPVRSMTTHFKLVTCPYIVNRLKRDLAMCGQKNDIEEIVVNGLDVAKSPDFEGDLYLEEFAVKVEKTKMDKLLEVIGKLIGKTTEELKVQLVVVSDCMFNHLSQFATPVNAHIKIENSTKIVKNGALWYEETLPPETALYSVLIANNSRKDGITEGLDLLNKTKEIFKDGYIQIGGNETVGMGWCEAVFYGE